MIEGGKKNLEKESKVLFAVLFSVSVSVSMSVRVCVCASCFIVFSFVAPKRVPLSSRFYSLFICFVSWKSSFVWVHTRNISIMLKCSESIHLNGIRKVEHSVYLMKKNMKSILFFMLCLTFVNFHCDGHFLPKYSPSFWAESLDTFFSLSIFSISNVVLPQTHTTITYYELFRKVHIHFIILKIIMLKH